MKELLSDSELFDDSTVTVDILLGEVVEKVSSVTYHLKKTAAGMMVILVGLEVLGEGVDAMRKDRDLNFGRTGIALMGLVLVDELLFYFFLNHG